MDVVTSIVDVIDVSLASFTAHDLLIILWPHL
jgi:hypothetical protein